MVFGNEAMLERSVPVEQLPVRHSYAVILEPASMSEPEPVNVMLLPWVMVGFVAGAEMDALGSVLGGEVIVTLPVLVSEPLPFVQVNDHVALPTPHVCGPES